MSLATTVERVGESVLVTVVDNANKRTFTLLLEARGAIELGQSLVMTALLGADQLDTLNPGGLQS